MVLDNSELLKSMSIRPPSALQLYAAAAAQFAPRGVWNSPILQLGMPFGASFLNRPQFSPSNPPNNLITSLDQTRASSLNEDSNDDRGA